MEGGRDGEGNETEWSVKSRCQNYLQVISSLRFSWNKLDEDTVKQRNINQEPQRSIQCPCPS